MISGLARYRDVIAKSVVILYDLQDEAREAYSYMHDAFEQLAACSNTWHIEAAGKVNDSKNHAGAAGVVSRKDISLSVGKLPFIKTNIEVPKIPVGKQFIAFLPDRLLVFEPKAVGAVSYQDLEIQVEEQPFVEEEHVPKDAHVIDYTGPDKGFKDNRQIPVAIYEKLHFKSNSVLNEVIQVSKTGFGESFRMAIEKLAKVNQDLSGELAKAAQGSEDWFKRGIELFNTGEYQQAITAFDDVIKIKPEHQLAYYNRGCVYIKLGERKQAIEDLKTAAKLGHNKSQEILKSKGISWV
jgi:tetratricopeptide (TPR) repeat protein